VCLNSSPAQLAGELWSSANMFKVAFWWTWFFINLGHNFRSRNAKKPIKGSIDLNYSLVCNETFESKTLGYWFDAQGPMTSAKMREPTPVMTSLRKKSKPQLFQLKKWTISIFRGFEQLSYSIGWWVMVVQSSA